ncbi:MAG: glycosyltransferase family 39 protein [Phycisphaerales bacterium]|nr:glycosyltransferase family 39 protein [Phycisphaerales bacterium]
MTRALRESILWQTVIVLGAALAVHLPLLGASGLADSEGFRAIPAWEMLHSGDWGMTTLFGQPYLRKPPGVTWAIAASSAVFGETEFAARLVSALAATGAALALFLFATRRWGPPFGLWAGLAYTLTPWFWRWGRSAEIESLHNALVLVSALLVVHAATRARCRLVPAGLFALALGAALGGALLVKGPAGLACIAGALLGPCVATRSFRPLARWPIWAGLGIGLVTFGAWFVMAASRASALADGPVVQSPSEFLWAPGKVAQVLTLGPVTLLGALPFALALPLALMGARHSDPLDREGEGAGRALAWAMLLALVFETLIGVSNNRYAMPAVTWMPAVYAFALWRQRAGANAWAGRLGRAVLLGRPGLVCGVMLLAAWAHLAWFEHRRDSRTSGLAAGLALGAALPPGDVWADKAIDSRPEVLWYAAREASRLGKPVAVHWVPGLAELAEPPRGTLVLLEGQDTRPQDPPEIPGPQRARLGLSVPVWSGTAHVFRMVAVRSSH